MLVIPTLLVSVGWLLAGFAILTVQHAAAGSGAAGAIIGLATGSALYLTRLLDEVRGILVLVAVWLVSTVVPVIVQGSHPDFWIRAAALCLATAATGLTLRALGKALSWHVIAWVAAGAGVAPLAGFLVSMPLMVVGAFADAIWLLPVSICVAACVAGAIAGRIMLSAYRRDLASVPQTTVAADSSEIRYEVFISYRGTGADKFWAEWLQSQLETWRTPRALAQLGVRSRLQPVFRDETDLPASADLPGQLAGALDRSRFFILVCSPRTRHSPWVLKELTHFVARHGPEHVLCMLIEGELRDVLPAGTSVVDGKVIGSATFGVEPIAADVRSDPRPPGWKKRRRALLKLLAPILGVSLDDLMRREALRQRQIALIVGAAAAGLLAVVATLVSGRMAADRLVRANGIAQKAAGLLSHRPVAALIVAAHALSENIESGAAPDLSIMNTLFAAMHRNGGIPLLGHASAVTALAFSADEKWLVSAEVSGDLAFWDLKASPPKRTWQSTTRRVFALSASHAGANFVVGEDSLVTLCEAKIADIKCTGLGSADGAVLTVAFSPNDQWIAAGGESPGVRLWRRTESGAYRVVSTLHTALPVARLAWSPNGDWLAASTAHLDRPGEAEARNSVLLWKFADTEPGPGIQLPPTAASSALQFSPDGQLLVAGDVEGNLRFWHVAQLRDQAPAVVTHRSSSAISHAVFNKSSDWIVTGENDGTVLLWDLSNGLAQAKFNRVSQYFAGRSDRVRSVAISSQDDVAIASSFSALWHGHLIYADAQLTRIGGHDEALNSVVFNASGTLLATADSGGAVRLFDIRSGIDGGSEWSSAHAARLSADGKWLATLENKPQLYAAADGFQRSVTLTEFDEKVVALAFAPTSDALVALGISGSARLWWLAGGVKRTEALQRISAEFAEGSHANIAFDASGALFAVTGNDGRGSVWRRADHAVEKVGELDHVQADTFRVLPVRADLRFGRQVLALSFSDDKRWLVTGNASGCTIVWSLTSDGEASPLTLAAWDCQHYPAEVTSVKLVELFGHHLLLTGGADGRLIARSWINGTAKVLATHSAFNGFVQSAAIDEAERWLVLGGGINPRHALGVLPQADSRALVWKLNTINGKPATLQGFKGPLAALAFRPGGQMLAASSDAGIQFWDLAVEPPAAVPLKFEFWASRLEFSKDGRYLLATGGASRLWSLEPAVLLRRAERLAGRNLTKEERSELFGGNSPGEVFRNLP